MAQLFDPETVRTLAEQMARTGNVDPTGGAAANNAGSPFEQQLALLATAEKVTPRTALGVLLGQALAGGINAWKQNYDDRGYIKDRFAAATPEERAAMLETIRQGNAARADRLANLAAQQGLQVGNAPQLVPTPAPATPSILGDAGRLSTAANIPVTDVDWQRRFSLRNALGWVR